MNYFIVVKIFLVYILSILFILDVLFFYVREFESFLQIINKILQFFIKCKVKNDLNL